METLNPVKRGTRLTLSTVQTLEQLRNAGPSPHINFLHKALINGVPGHASLILEYCEMGNIQSMINTNGMEDAIVAEGFVWHVVASVTKALCFLHEGVDVYKHDATPIDSWNPICHLDIKPDNVYLTNKHRNADYPRVVLGDLGCAVTRDDVVSGRVNRECPHQFTPSIVPPENRLEGDISRWKGKYGLVTDMWQLGGLMQVMCTKAHQPSLSKAKTMHACGPQYSFKANEIAWRLMHTDCTRRPKATELMEELRILLPPMGVIL